MPEIVERQTQPIARELPILESYRLYLPPALRGVPWRAHPLDGKLLLFDRHSGLNVLLEGDETAPLRRLAPRTLLIAVTNFCNLTCPFCYRALSAPSLWRYDDLLAFCQEADAWGVLEVAFGGGEPLIFPCWQDFIQELYETSRLCINFTTNGTLLTESFLRAIQGRSGQIRLSIYHDNHWQESIQLLARTQARFGINWLITPDVLRSMETIFGQLLESGVRDFLFLRYKGEDPALHLNAADCQHLAQFLGRVHTRLGPAVSLKLDACWGEQLAGIPRLFEEHDCGAGDSVLSITSDKRIKPCSFHHGSIPFESLSDVRRSWERCRHLQSAAHIGGCARLPNRGT